MCTVRVHYSTTVCVTYLYCIFARVLNVAHCILFILRQQSCTVWRLRWRWSLQGIAPHLSATAIWCCWGHPNKCKDHDGRRHFFETTASAAKAEQPWCSDTVPNWLETKCPKHNTYVQIPVYIYIYTCICICIYIYIYINIHVHTSALYIYIYVHIYMMNIYIYIYINIHTFRYLGVSDYLDLAA